MENEGEDVLSRSAVENHDGEVISATKREKSFLLLSVVCEIPLLYSGDSAGLVCITGTLHKVSCASALS